MTGSYHEAELAALRLLAAGASLEDAAAEAGLDISDVEALRRRLVRAASREYHPSRRGDFAAVAAAALDALKNQQDGQGPTRQQR